MNAAIPAVRIEELRPDLEARVAAFLLAHDDATVFHEPWFARVLTESYGHACDYWVALQAERVVGIFPVVTVAHPLLGRKAVAMPYQFHSGPPLAEAEDGYVALLEAAKARVVDRGVAYFEIRNHVEAPLLERLGFIAQDTQLTKTMVPLAGLAIGNLRRGHKKELKKALEEDVRIEVDASIEALQAFRRVYMQEGRDLAGPQAGWAYFESLHCLAGDRYRLLIAHHGTTCIGGAILLDNRKVMFGRNGAYSHALAAKFKLSRSLIWHCMQDAAARGCREFDLGVTWVGNQGLIDFKEGWTGVTHPVRAYILPVKSQPPPPGSYFEGYRLAKALWRKLPMPIVDRLGHAITRWVC
jgi:hypothetical protein